jgi:amino acid transporter
MLAELTSLLVVAVAVLGRGGGPDGVDVGASFNPEHVFAGGLTGSSGIALAFAFASYIGFEATAIYGEESNDPERTVPRATYIAIGVITLLFAATSFAIVSGLGASHVVDRVGALSTVDGTPLADPAAVLFSVASDNVGHWLATTMSWLVTSSLFAGLLAFQNCSARYLFSLSRAGVLPRPLARTNGFGAPALASLTASVLTGAVIVAFVLDDLDPVVNLFYWTAGVAVIAVVAVEILVCAAVLVHFRRGVGRRWWSTGVAPVLAGAGLLTGLYLLMSRFGLLAGTVPAGVDPATSTWRLNPTGWTLIGAPFAALALGGIVGYAVTRAPGRRLALAEVVG